MKKNKIKTCCLIDYDIQANVYLDNDHLKKLYYKTSTAGQPPVHNPQ